MRAVVQRSLQASVTVDNEVIGSIDSGLVVFLGIQEQDNEQTVRWMADKIIHLRIFEDDDGKMNKSLAETGGEMLIVSQFTLYGDCRKGRRPGYSGAAAPATAKTIYDSFITSVQHQDIVTATGRFQAAMQVQLTNDGPVTLLIDSDKTF